MIMSLSIEEVHNQLVEACLDGELNTLFQTLYYNKDNAEKLLRADVPHLHKNKYGKHKPGDYLYIACENDSQDVVQHLIKLGADPFMLYKDNIDLSHLVCQKGHLKTLEILVAAGVELHPPGVSLKESNIYIATYYGNVQVIKYIVEQVPDILSQTFTGGLGVCPGIDYADIWVGLSTIVASENNSTKTGNMLLYIASLLKHFEVVKFLVSSGVTVQCLFVTKSFYASMYTPLAVACKNSDYQTASYLLQQKAEITTSIADQYPEFTAFLLKKYMHKYKRSYSLSEMSSQSDTANGYSVYWDTLSLPKIHRSWLTIHGSQICSLDVHDNNITSLPEDFFALMRNLEDIDISCNSLKSIPSEGLESLPINRLIGCKNEIGTLPLQLLNNPYILRIDFTNNRIEQLPTASDDVTSLWKCTALKFLKLSSNKLIFIPKAITGAISLEKLYLDKNVIQQFHWTWRCPLIDLDLSSNQLEEFSLLSQMVWSKSLQKLNLADNSIGTILNSVCHLQNLQYLDFSRNALKVLPPPSNWKCRQLCKLNLSHNMLTASSGPDGFLGVEKSEIEEVMSGKGRSMSIVTSCELPDAFVGTLMNLDLSYNLLEIVPESVCKMVTLNELDLSNNPCLNVLPAELANLKNIWNLRLNNLIIPDLPFTLDDSNHGKSVLSYLRAKLRKSVPFNRMKLMVVGLQARGKTTLVATLQGKGIPPDISTVGISVKEWSLSSPSRNSALFTPFWKDWSSSNAVNEIVFSTWDLAGQHVYYATHQCFLTSNTLYLAVFNVVHGQEGVDSLAQWLLNIQARAPFSRVIVVGTHVDRLPIASKKAFLHKIKESILNKYDKKGYPIISGCDFVSNTSGEGLVSLRDKIYSVAYMMNESNAHGSQGKYAPLSYIQLNDAIVKESKLRQENSEPPILTLNEMMALAQSNPDNDIFSVEELITAAKFLHENGILLHFNDQLRELNTLFFIDPSWLCDMLSLVVTVRESNPFVLGGYIKLDDLMLVLKNPRLPEKFIPQYLRLLERFEIALRLDEARFLIPSMLPKERPGFLMNQIKEKCVDCKTDDINASLILYNDQYIWRNYHMSYIPSGFWSRLIARIIIAVNKWGMAISLVSPPQSDSSLQEHDYTLVYWREGILILYDGGYFLVDSFFDDCVYENQSNKGVAINVWSKDADFSAMGFIVDHLDMLITEWYPGLEDVDEFGDPLIKKQIPCPICVLQQQQKLLASSELSVANLKNNLGSLYRNIDLVHPFDLQVCALAATCYQAISCPCHPNEPVTLELVVPDLLLTDLPSELIIDPKIFEFTTTEENRLGEGGAGGVYLGKYKQEAVAVKQFHSTTKAKGFNTASSTSVMSETIFTPSLGSSIQDQMEDGKVVRAFWELRQEVAVLCRLKHPNVVRFVGVCHSPLCFLLELAPMGSLLGALVSALEEREKKETGLNKIVVGPVLGEIVTHKIALQVAHALNYLHESEIIYRDLKSDNVLLWSLNEDDVINVKLSDYGISTFVTPQGVIGEGGTPGFQAPEVRVGCAYDEKVDVFSYGIWLYELISGLRPYKEYRTSSEIKRALYRGLRPSLQKDGIDSCMPYLELLMEDCWNVNPVFRPSAFEIIHHLDTIGVLLMKSMFGDPSALQRVTSICSWERKNTTTRPRLANESCMLLLIWCDDNGCRKYVIADANKRVIKNGGTCPGARVLCCLQVEDYIWLGTEGRLLEVFGSVGCHKEGILWSYVLKDHVMSLLQYQGDGETKVIASLANGTLAVFLKRLEDRSPLFKEETNDLIDHFKENWVGPQLVNLLTDGLPVKCMVVVARDELWVSSGNKIVIVDPHSFELLKQIKVLKSPKSLITSMITDGRFVWAADRRSSVITQWDVTKRELILRFQCNVLDPIKKNLVIKPPLCDLTETAVNQGDGFDVPSENILDDMQSAPMESRGAKRLSSFLLNSNENFRRSGSKFVRSARPSLITKPSARRKELLSKQNQIHLPRLRTSALSDDNDRVTCLYFHANVLWIGRSSGDILAINVCSEDEGFGCVIAHLHRNSKQKFFQTPTNFVMLGTPRQLCSLIRKEPRNRTESSLKATNDTFLLALIDACACHELNVMSKRLGMLREKLTLN